MARPYPPPCCLRRRARVPRLGGFTLIELMVTVSIMGILAALAGPPMAGFIASQRLRAMASDLNIALIKTRSEAIKRNANVTLVPIDSTNGWKSGWRIPDPKDGTQFLAEWPPKNNSEITATPSGLASVVYKANGRIVATDMPMFEIAPTTASITTDRRCVGIATSGKPYAKVKVGTSC